MSKIHNIFIKQHQRGRWRYHWGHVNATVLKVKLSMSIISISSIHLLQTFVNASKIPEKNNYVGSNYSFCFLDFSNCDGLYRQNSVQYKPQKPLIHKVRSKLTALFLFKPMKIFTLY